MTMMIAKGQKKRILLHAEEHIEYILEDLGIDYSRRGPLYQSKCLAVHHGGDGNNPTAFSWSEEYRRWRCWTHACHEQLGDDVFGLVRSVEDMGFEEAVRWVWECLERHGVDVGEVVEQPERRSAVDIKKPMTHEPLDEFRLRFLEKNYTYLMDRGFNRRVLLQYEVGVWNRPGTNMHNRVIWPIRDSDGFLVGFTGRCLDDDAVEAGKEEKWKHGRFFDRFSQERDLHVGSLLFNLHRAIEHIGERREIILVEGPLDGMRLEQAGIHNWVAPLGANLTPAQMTLMINAGINKLVVALDPDKAGDKASSRIREQAGDYFHIRRAMLPDDPGDCELDVLRKELCHES